MAGTQPQGTEEAKTDWGEKLRYEVELYFKIHFAVGALLSFFLVHCIGVEQARTQQINAWAEAVHLKACVPSADAPVTYPGPIAVPIEWPVIYLTPVVIFLLLQIAAAYNWSGYFYIHEARLNWSPVNGGAKSGAARLGTGRSAVLPILIDRFYMFAGVLLMACGGFGLSNFGIACLYAFGPDREHAPWYPLVSLGIAGVGALVAVGLHRRARTTVLRRLAERGEVGMKFVDQLPWKL